MHKKEKRSNGENSLITCGMWFTITQPYSSCFQDVRKGMSLQHMYNHNLFVLTSRCGKFRGNKTAPML